MALRRSTALAITAAVTVALSPAAEAATSPPSARQRATRQCKAELKRLGTRPFHDKYGVHNTKSALAKCVSRKLRKK